MTSGGSSLQSDAPRTSDLESVRSGVAAYYTDKVKRFGATPLGVDWSCVPTQEMRFVQLMKLCDAGNAFSLDDVGCGYGALLTFLDWRYPEAEVDYLGIDLSAAMVRRARRLWKGRRNARFVVGDGSPRLADYALASGIFNVQLDQPLDMWEAFIAATLTRMNNTATRGFAVNFVQPPSASQAPRRGLYTVEPGKWARFCEATFGTTVQVVDGYGLREFTLLMRR